MNDFDRTEEAFIIFIEYQLAQEIIQVSSAHTMIKNAMAVWSRDENMAQEMETLAVYRRGIREEGGDIANSQATPFTRQDFYKFLTKLDDASDAYWAAWTTWKTASRYDEIENTQTTDFKRLTRTIMRVRFGGHRERNGTRRRRRGHKGDKAIIGVYQLIEDSARQIDRLEAHLMRQGDSMFTTVTGSMMYRLIREHNGQGYGLHSIKRGALQHIMKHRPQEISIADALQKMSKHRDPFREVPLETRKYLDRDELALEEGSATLSKLL